MKVWTIALVGRPNAGKSTFLNTLLEEKVSLVASSPQATRRSIRGIYQDDEKQLVFVDLPWYHHGESAMSRALIKEFEKWLRKVDVILHFVDSSRSTGSEQQALEERLSYITQTPIITVYTKSDRKTLQWDKDKDIFITSSDRSSYRVLVDHIVKYLSDSDPLYADDYYTDQDIYTRASEVIRECVIEELKEELPHAVAVDVTQFDRDPDGKTQSIFAYIIVESDSQKGIILGKGAQRLVEVREKARAHLDVIFGTHTKLFLRVKVVKNWRKNESFIRQVVFGEGR